MEKAIQIAIEGGWLQGGTFNELDPILCDVHMYHSNGQADSVCRYEMLLDPLFWQALGKVEGWEVITEYFRCPADECDDCREWASFKICPECGTKLESFKNSTRNWKIKWHNFIDHIAKGKSIDSFFDNLLTNK